MTEGLTAARRWEYRLLSMVGAVLCAAVLLTWMTQALLSAVGIHTKLWLPFDE